MLSFVQKVLPLNEIGHDFLKIQLFQVIKYDITEVSVFVIYKNIFWRSETFLHVDKFALSLITTD